MYLLTSESYSRNKHLLNQNNKKISYKSAIIWFEFWYCKIFICPIYYKFLIYLYKRKIGLPMNRYFSRWNLFYLTTEKLGPKFSCKIYHNLIGYQKFKKNDRRWTLSLPWKKQWNTTFSIRFPDSYLGNYH